MRHRVIVGVGVIAAAVLPSGLVAAQEGPPPTFPSYSWNGITFDFTREVWQEGEERQVILGGSTTPPEACQRPAGADDVFLTYAQDPAEPQGGRIAIPAPPGAPLEFVFTEPLHDDIAPAGAVGPGNAADACGFALGPAPGAVEAGTVVVDTSAPQSLIGPVGGWAYAVQLAGEAAPAPITSVARALAGIDEGLLVGYPIGPGGSAFTLGCTISGTPQADVLFGTRHDDVICGGGGDDLIFALGGADAVLGDGGHDWLFGGPGDDLVVGGYGDDVADGGFGNDTLFGGWGMTPIAYPDFFAADATMPSDGDDLASGGFGDDTVVGGYGEDRLAGGPGADRLIGGFGADRVLGGPNIDTCQEEAEPAASC